MTLQDCLDFLAVKADPAFRAQLAERFGIPNENAYGVPMGRIKAFARKAGKDHALAAALWASGSYEARLLALHVDDPAHLTPAQMDAWVGEFDNWAICDTACFTLFDRTPHAWGRVPVWIASETLYTRRAGLALIWALSRHDKRAPDSTFNDALAMAEGVADDPRPHVQKAVSMAMRAVSKRNDALHAAADEAATRLETRDAPAARRTARDLRRALRGSAATRRGAQ